MLKRRRENQLMNKEKLRRAYKLGASIIDIKECENAERRCCTAFPVYAVSVLADNSSGIVDEMKYLGGGHFRMTTNIKNITPLCISSHTDGSALHRHEVFCSMLDEFLAQLKQTIKARFADVLKTGICQTEIDVEYVPDNPNHLNILICHIEYNATENLMIFKCPSYAFLNQIITSKELDEYTDVLLNF